MYICCVYALVYKKKLIQPTGMASNAVVWYHQICDIMWWCWTFQQWHKTRTKCIINRISKHHRLPNCMGIIYLHIFFFWFLYVCIFHTVGSQHDHDDKDDELKNTPYHFCDERYFWFMSDLRSSVFFFSWVKNCILFPVPSSLSHF